MEKKSQNPSASVKQPLTESPHFTALRRIYLGMLREALEQLRAKIESGEFRGYNGEDTESGDLSLPVPFFQLQREVERLVIPNDEVAFLVLACSVSGEDLYWSGGDPSAEAATVATHDLLAMAYREGWYHPDDAEEPSPRQLAAVAASLAL